MSGKLCKTVIAPVGFQIEYCPGEVWKYYGTVELGPPFNATKLLSNDGGAAWLIPKDTKFLRGIDQGCSRLPYAIKDQRKPLWLTWRPSTALLYTRGHADDSACIHGFKAKRQLLLLNLMDGRTLLEFEQRMNKSLVSLPPQERDKIVDAYKVYTGRFTNKYINETEQIAAKYGWTANLKGAVVSPFPATSFPHVKKTADNSVVWENATYGNNLENCMRASFMESDMIITLQVMKLFPGYDGILSLQTPGAAHGGSFHEEVIIFPNVLDKIDFVTPLTPTQTRKLGGSLQSRKQTSKHKLRKTRRSRVYRLKKD